MTDTVRLEMSEASSIECIVCMSKWNEEFMDTYFLYLWTHTFSYTYNCLVWLKKYEQIYDIFKISFT